MCSGWNLLFIHAVDRDETLRKGSRPLFSVPDVLTHPGAAWRKGRLTAAPLSETLPHPESADLNLLFEG
jgi:hypothetical protein